MKIGIANDHRGYNLKNELVKYLKSRGYEVIDYGSDTVYSVDYPDFAFKLCNGVVNNPEKDNFELEIRVMQKKIAEKDAKIKNTEKNT